MLERAIQEVRDFEDTLFLENLENVRANQFYKSICLEIFLALCIEKKSFETPNNLNFPTLIYVCSIGFVAF